MAKYLQQTAGDIEEVSPVTTSAGAADGGKIAQLNPAGQFDTSLLPPGIGADTRAIPASENLSAGDFVNIFDAGGGVANVRKAIATGLGTRADGYVIQPFTQGTVATVYFDDLNNGMTGLTLGMQFLSTTIAGKTQTAPPTGAGNISQKLGKADSASTIHVKISDPIKLA